MSKRKMICFFAIIFGVIIEISDYSPVCAKTVTDEQHNRIEIQDKYFVNMPTEQDLSKALGLYQEATYYLNHLDEQMPSELQHHFEYKTMRDKVESLYSPDSLSWKTREQLRLYLLSQYTPHMAIHNYMNQVHGGLDTDNMRFTLQKNGIYQYSAILKPSNITVYNQTGRKDVTNAINQAAINWNDTPGVHFRLVSSPKDARVIIRQTNGNDSDVYFEQATDAVFNVTETYAQCLVQGDVILSSDLLKSQDKKKLVHAVTHEFGHVLGMPDLY
ncbi:hypothetical protein [Companilactobacillus ginsenosidimutans]|uniref:Peptidase M10 metallopeptidase domain-containing protein n=1 Tax=Companilactobacillus ginsenosidimutans TaxID=1007676 RepID=A0A0H4QKK4_9LACO|nr:hypothetical protein [Companilactobacillus ginsenosidimutans]AKP67616.1 hypothetical protein ABM34_08785 [Companilactobacillus ginsenosidimutans]